MSYTYNRIRFHMARSENFGIMAVCDLPWKYTPVVGCKIKIIFPGMGTPILKIRRPDGRLIFTIGIPNPHTAKAASIYWTHCSVKSNLKHLTRVKYLIILVDISWILSLCCCYEDLSDSWRTSTWEYISYQTRIISIPLNKISNPPYASCGAQICMRVCVCVERNKI